MSSVDGSLIVMYAPLVAADAAMDRAGVASTISTGLLLRCFAEPISVISVFFALEAREVREDAVMSLALEISVAPVAGSFAILRVFFEALLDCMGLL